MKPVIGVMLLLFVVAAVVFVFRARHRGTPTVVAPFAMKIDDRFALKTDGKVVVVGVVSVGEVQPGDSLEVQSATSRLPVTVEALEAYNRPVTRATAGDRVGIMLIGATKADITPGDMLKGKEP